MGLAGLYFEFAHPESSCPVLLAVSPDSAFLPCRPAGQLRGVLLILLRIILFIAEVKVMSHGILTLAVYFADMGSCCYLTHRSCIARILGVMIPALIVISMFCRVDRPGFEGTDAKTPFGQGSMISGRRGGCYGYHERERFYPREYWNAWSDKAVEKGKKDQGN